MAVETATFLSGALGRFGHVTRWIVVVAVAWVTMLTAERTPTIPSHVPLMAIPVSVAAAWLLMALMVALLVGALFLAGRRSTPERDAYWGKVGLVATIPIAIWWWVLSQVG